MSHSVSRKPRLIGVGFSFAATIGIGLLTGSSAFAQATAGPSPGCSLAGLQQSNGTSGPDATSSFACVADLNGDGIPELVIGQTGIGERAAGYALFFSANGAVRRKTCWTDGSATVSLCPD